MIRRNKDNIKNKTVVSPYIYKYNTMCKYRRGRSRGTSKRPRTGMIKVSGLIHKRIKKSDPWLAWFMLHKIYRMYSDIKKKEEKIILRYSQSYQNTKNQTK